MKIISKFIMPFVFVIALASCSPLAPKPTETLSPIPPTQTPFLPISVDRHDPEAVLRAYFDAWGQSNWLALASFMDEKYGRIVGEPVDSIRILEIQLVSSSPTDYVYSVLFDIKMKGQGVNMDSGQVRWTYVLTWYENSDSWLISNYGAG